MHTCNCRHWNSLFISCSYIRIYHFLSLWNFGKSCSHDDMFAITWWLVKHTFNCWYFGMVNLATQLTQSHKHLSWKIKNIAMLSNKHIIDGSRLPKWVHLIRWKNVEATAANHIIYVCVCRKVFGIMVLDDNARTTLKVISNTNCHSYYHMWYARAITWINNNQNLATLIYKLKFKFRERKAAVNTFTIAWVNRLSRFPWPKISVTN